MNLRPLPLIVALALPGTVSLTAGCGPRTAARAPETSPSPAAAGEVRLSPESLRLARFDVAPVAAQARTETLRWNGAVDRNPSHMAQVNARVKARITSLSAERGQSVQAGQVIAIVESEDLHGAQVAYRLALKREALCRDTLTRRRKLAGLGEVERHHLEEYQQRLSQADGQVSDADGDVKTARAALDEAHGEEKSLAAQREQAATRLATAAARAQRADTLYKEELISRQDQEQAQAERRQAQAEVSAADARREQGAARVRNARAKLESAEARLQVQSDQQRRAAEALTREEKVARSGLIRDKDVVEAENALQQATIAVESARDDIELLGGQPGDQHAIPIHAPISGRVLERHATLGETVDMTRPIYTLFDDREVWVQLSVPPADAARLRPGQSITVRTDAAPGRAFTARIASISDVADPTSRLVAVRGKVAGASGLLRPGMFVTGERRGSAGPPTIAVPAEALVERDGRRCVYVATDDPAVFVARPVEVIEEREGTAWLRSGLSAGERIVTHNAALLRAQEEKGQGK